MIIEPLEILAKFDELCRECDPYECGLPYGNYRDKMEEILEKLIKDILANPKEYKKRYW